MKALLAAGGSGTRLRPLTFSSNKQLLPVLNKPLILYPFEAIVETGIKEIGIIVNETRAAVENLIGDGSKWGVKVTYIDQPQPLGLAHVVAISETFIDGHSFVYVLGDNIFSQGILKPFKHFEAQKLDGLLTIVKHKENWRLGVPVFDASGKLIEVIEKPKNPPNQFAVPGLYMFGPSVYNAFKGDDAIKPSVRGELEITDLYTYLLKHNYKVESEEIDGMWLDPGKFDDMIDAHHYLLDQMETHYEATEVSDDSVIRGQLVAGRDTRILQSRIDGPVHIGEGTIIENCTVGPYVTIGSHCTLSHLTITNSVIYDHTSLKKVSKVIIDSLVGKNTNVWEAGHGSISFFIGDNCNVRVD